jgi:hypothetical protein
MEKWATLKSNCGAGDTKYQMEILQLDQENGLYEHAKTVPSNIYSIKCTHNLFCIIKSIANSNIQCQQIGRSFIGSLIYQSPYLQEH